MRTFAAIFAGFILLASPAAPARAESDDQAQDQNAESAGQPRNQSGAVSSGEEAPPESGQGVTVDQNADAPAAGRHRFGAIAAPGGGAVGAAPAPAQPAEAQASAAPSTGLKGCNAPVAATRIGARYRCPKAFNCGSANGQLTPFLQVGWAWGVVAAELGKYNADVMGQFFGTTTCDGASSLAVVNSLVLFDPQGIVPDSDQFGKSVTDGKCKRLYPNFQFPDDYAETSRAGLSLTAWDNGFCYYEPAKQ
jgi:hypothetical protein